MCKIDLPIYEFSKATHPQEKACFAIAVKTFNFWEAIISERPKKED